MQST
ncbi:hypothetical protein LINPERPRIM_LOCUS33505 [Linum perenne]|jgi:hypothetical protein